MISRLIAKYSHCMTHTNLVTVTDIYGRIFLLDMTQQHLCVHQFRCLALLGLAEAYFHHLCNVLLLHIVLVELLDTGYLIVREPIRRLCHSQFINRLSIKLLIVYLSRIIDILSFWYL